MENGCLAVLEKGFVLQGAREKQWRREEESNLLEVGEGAEHAQSSDCTGGDSGRSTIISAETQSKGQGQYAQGRLRGWKMYELANYIIL